MNDEWLDNILDGEPSGITDTQWLIIESNINQTSLTTSMKSNIINRINELTELEAEEIITIINENRYEKDTRKQWEKMLRDGVFSYTDL
mgnify:CR=1 FL=1|tara:strand:+ start:6752 stop:7018 length:267 start_codon:yes stop_codon:yes gene_type:complete